MKKMMLMAAVCLMAAMTFAAQCVATTKKGTQCKREASPGSEFCWQHGGTTKAERATGETESSPHRKARRSESDDAESAPAPRRKASRSAPEETEAVPTPRRKTNRNESAEATSEPAADGQCQATTKSGAPCKRKAQAGGKYCAQHAAKMGKGGTEVPAARPKRRAKPKAETSETAPSASSAEAADGQCQAKTKNGTPCRRKAQAGGKYCAQHAAKVDGSGTETPVARPKRRAKPKAASGDDQETPAARPRRRAKPKTAADGETEAPAPRPKRRAKPKAEVVAP